MNIALIGMSNIGKTRWSRRLANGYGFTHIECDVLIEQKLDDELIRLGYSGIRDVAKWMGQPYEPRYAETSRKYAACERAVMLDVFDRLRTEHNDKPTVLDTTGSVIYTGDDICADLKRHARVVYFEASPAHLEQLFRLYMASPKPVIWGDTFQMREGESCHESLHRCYPELLKSRAERYRKIADVVVPFELHRKPDADIELLIGQKG